MRDRIEIRRLRVACHIGVPDEERAAAQELWISVMMTPAQGFDGLGDRISRTIDYAAVAADVRILSAARPRHLIETLAVETADLLLSRYPLARVELTIEKHILPDTECVAVHLARER